MRGDTVGVGDVGEVQGRTRGAGHAASGDDGRGAERERQSGIVIRPRVDEHHPSGQQSWDGIDIDDGAWSEHGAGVVHGLGDKGTNRMRSDTVGVGDVGEVSDRPWSKGIKADGHHGGRASGQRHPGLVDGHSPDQHHSPG